MKFGAVFCVGNLTCSFHMLHSWPTQFYVAPPTLTFLATLVRCTSPSKHSAVSFMNESLLLNKSSESMTQ